MAAGRQYVVNEAGRKTAVVLTVREFNRIRRRLEDLEDALELRNAVNTEREFRDLREIQKDEPAANRHSSKAK